MKGLHVIFSMLFLANIYGDIMKIDTTGASEKTAKQDKLTIKGEKHAYNSHLTFAKYTAVHYSLY